MKFAPKIGTLQYRYVFRSKTIANYIDGIFMLSVDLNIDSPTMKQKTESFSCVRCFLNDISEGKHFVI